jgi:chlorite dismutase
LHRIAYLIVYPFVKTVEWYLLSRDTRQGMMNQFSDLVNELRGSESRRYTERDTPNFTAIWRSTQALGDLYAGEQG